MDPEKYQPPALYVTKWVDYSTKYGIGYLLNNDTIGVFFNDSSKIVIGQFSK